MSSKPLKIKLVSLFSGAGGLDAGFEAVRLGETQVFETVWANEYDRAIYRTYKAAFPGVKLHEGSITEVSADDLVSPSGESLVSQRDTPLGLIGGPPCQSWSSAGAKRGKDDHRGQLFWDYIRILGLVKPAFFVAENVPGILAQRNSQALSDILSDFAMAGYNVTYAKLNAAFHDVPEDRERVIFVGIRSDLEMPKSFHFPLPSKFDTAGRPVKMVLADLPSLRELASTAVPYNPAKPDSQQNEFMEGSFSPLFMSRNRCRTWDSPSFTIQATARHAPIHPDHGEMRKVGTDLFEFNPGKPFRRLSVRECAEIQTFAKTHRFIYDSVADGYKMIGNAVPVNLAKAVATSIAEYLVLLGDIPPAPRALAKGKQAVFVNPYRKFFEK